MNLDRIDLIRSSTGGRGRSAKEELLRQVRVKLGRQDDGHKTQEQDLLAGKYTRDEIKWSI